MTICYKMQKVRIGMLTKSNVQQNIQNMQIFTLNQLWLLIYLNKRITDVSFFLHWLLMVIMILLNLNASDNYWKRDIDLKIQKIECLSHVMGKMTNTYSIIE